MSSMWPEQIFSERERRREQRRDTILRELMRIKEEAASAAAARNRRHAGHPRTDPITEQEVNRRRSLEDSERHAAAQREQDRKRLVAELNELEHAEARYRAQRRKQNQAIVNVPQQPPRPDVSDSDGGRTTASCTEDGLQVTSSVLTSDTAVKPTSHPEVPESDADDEYEPDESDGEDELDSSGSGTRWVSKKYLKDNGLFGWGIYVNVYLSQTTGALYFRNNLDEQIWLTDANGDCVLAQEQSYSTP